MDLLLKGKRAAVAGGSRGIGRATALALAREGCHVAVAARNREQLEATAADLRALGVEVAPVVVDLATREGPERFVGDAAGALGGLDVLVNCAGGSSGGAFPETTEDDWMHGFDRNLWPAVRACRAALPRIREAGGGAIVNVSSIWGREAGGAITYNAAKAALISLSKMMAVQLAPHRIRVNSVAPGSTIHPGASWEKRQQKDPAGIAEFVKREIPWGRFGAPEEIGDVICFLCSERARWITGACIVIDGGQSRAF
jgi:3-oxoacyl-[acyl-carrier protein] reductase